MAVRDLMSEKSAVEAAPVPLLAKTLLGGGRRVLPSCMGSSVASSGGAKKVEDGQR